MDDVLVGIDVGTTTCKSVVFSLEGRTLHVGSRPTPWRTTLEGTEMAPEALLTAVRGAVADSLHGLAVRVVAAGVTGMAEAGVLLDGSGNPVSPILAWHDMRDAEEFDDLVRTFGDRFSATTGLPLWQQWSLTKHRWLLAHGTTSRRAVRRLGVPEWIAHTWGGAQASEQSLASRTGWLALDSRGWWSETLEWAGASPSLLPDLVEPLESVGVVTSDAVPSMRGAVLAIAGHDHQSAALGAGANRPGVVFNSCGTAEAFVCSAPVGLEAPAVLDLTRSGITVGWNVLPERLCLLGATRGGLLLRRTLDLVGVDGIEAQAALGEWALVSGPPRAHVAGADSGLMVITDVADGCRPEHLWRAALQSAVDAGSRMHERMETATGHNESTIAAGGWAQDAAFMALKRERLGDVRVTEAPEAGARGSALVAACAAGIYSGLADLPGPPVAEPSGR
jgi:sugar (pentulose or hexulose) kinase